MKINERRGDLPLSEKVNTGVLVRNAGDITEETSGWMLAEEYMMRVFINSMPVMQIVCTPTQLTELVLGRLLTEGYIRSLKDVRLIDVCREGSIAKVFLNPEKTKGSAGTAREEADTFDRGHLENEDDIRQNAYGTKGLSDMTGFMETVSTCCTDNRMLQELGWRSAGLNRVPELKWEPEWIWALDDRFGEDTELHRLTHATHACFLSIDGEISFEAEDIGRHNAIDKAVGWALRNDVPLERCIIYTTGRMPVDMVRKVIRAGIPVMVSKEAPTMEGFLLAKEYGLTLIGNLKHGKMRIYS